MIEVRCDAPARLTDGIKLPRTYDWPSRNAKGIPRFGLFPPSDLNRIVGGG
jgi:hypothetical protein